MVQAAAVGTMIRSEAHVAVALRSARVAVVPVDLPLVVAPAVAEVAQVVGAVQVHADVTKIDKF